MRCATAAVALGLSLALFSPASGAAASTCYGTPANGRLEHGVRIPASGDNFSPYSRLGVALGRTYVHSRVASTITAAYASLLQTAPGKVFVYGEFGWSEGGRIKPHRTHQNGLSVDFMVPVLDEHHRSVPLPTGVTNKFGYAIEFDAQARHDGMTIDFDAIAAHLLALQTAARANGISLSRVIFDRPYLPRLFAARHGASVRTSVSFMQGKPWIRHDEHYHVDFAVPCRAR